MRQRGLPSDGHIRKNPNEGKGKGKMQESRAGRRINKGNRKKRKKKTEKTERNRKKDKETEIKKK